MSTNSRSAWTEEISIGISEYKRLKEKAEETDATVEDVIRWLVEEHLDEL